VGYNAGIALYLIVWGFTLFSFFIFTLRTNLVFAMIFFFVDVGGVAFGRGVLESCGWEL